MSTTTAEPEYARLSDVPGPAREIRPGDTLHVVPPRGRPYQATVESLSRSESGSVRVIVRLDHSDRHGRLGSEKRRYYAEELQRWYAAGDLRINPEGPHDE